MMDNRLNNNQISGGGILQNAPSPEHAIPSPPSLGPNDWRESGYAEEEDSEFLGLVYWHVSDERRKAGIQRGRIVLLPDEVTELCKRAAQSREAARAYAMEHQHTPRARLAKKPQTIDINRLTGLSGGSF